MKEKIKMTHREKRENVAGFLFCLPCILGFLFFAAIPMIYQLYYELFGLQHCEGEPFCRHR